MKHRVLRLLVLSATLAVWTSAARASTSYPQAIADALGAPCVPQCTICHRDNIGGLATVAQPFGVTMIANGLGFFAPATIAPTLERVRAAGTDSDGDGTGDVDELASGLDPNGDLDLCGLAAQYGCGAHVAPLREGAGVSYPGIIGVLAMLALTLQRRRKSSVLAGRTPPLRRLRALRNDPERHRAEVQCCRSFSNDSEANPKT